MAACHICDKYLNERTEVRYETDGRTLCSLDCVFKYRGKQRCV